MVGTLHFSSVKPLFVNCMFFLKKNVKHFSLIHALLNTVFCVLLLIMTETVFCDTLRIICHNDFKCVSIDFHKQRK